MEEELKQEKDNKSELEVPLKSVREAFFTGYGRKGTSEGQEEFAKLLQSHLKQEIEKYPSAKKYNIVILFDNTTLVKSDSDKIYQAVKSFEKSKKPLLLVLVSGGGEPGSAYLIGKLCREFLNEKFVVVVPRHAKSAATLLTCAADEIHMGSLSELGPIDPQINGMPALGLKSSIEHIVDMVAKNPSSGEMFAKYLSLSIEPVQIGYYERVAESSEQYAERLLNTHRTALASSPKDIATKLVKEYKDHGFVIDKEEAIAIFGENIIKCGMPEYALGSAIYDILSDIEGLAESRRYKFYFIGTLEAKPNVFLKR